MKVVAERRTAATSPLEVVQDRCPLEAFEIIVLFGDLFEEGDPSSGAA